MNHFSSVTQWSRLGMFFALVTCMSDLHAEPFQLAWTNNLLTVSRSDLPGGPLKIWYLEAFLRPGAHQQDWGRSVMPHKTRLLEASADGKTLRFETRIGQSIQVRHEVRAGEDELDLRFELQNLEASPSDLQWFQPACIRVEGFTGANQTNYLARSFIFTTNGLRTLDGLRRTTEALYRGGQVYVPNRIPTAEANPRPICLDRPINGLMGCFSADGRWLLATASDRTHELFEGVYVCLHTDPHIGGLRPNEVRRVRQKIYLMPNEPARLLERYRKDFQPTETDW